MPGALKKASYLLVFFAFIFSLNLVSKAQSGSSGQYTLFFIGDAGEINASSEQNLKSLKKRMTQAGKNSVTIFLGDNIYSNGMPERGHKKRLEAENIYQRQLSLFKDYPGIPVVVHGNHDWHRGYKGGWENVLHAEEFAEEMFPERQIVYPESGCPGPTTIEVGEEILLLIFDSQWILHQSDRPSESESSESKTGLELFANLQHIIKNNQHKKIVMVAHHPVISYGEHGGKSNFRQHVFPFTDANKNLYLPLPIVGSLYPLYRKYIGNVQDNSHPLNRVMRESMRELCEMHPDIIYVSGHEHSLQYINKNNAFRS